MPFTKEQEDAIRATQPVVCVSAGAGSGKTAILIARIAHLLAHPELWPDKRPGLDRIVAITFTDKAAAEMKARLRAEFRKRPGSDSPQDMNFWREMERQVDSARVSTIHAFCSSILREHALRIGLDPDWSVLAEAETQQLAEEAVVETINRLLEEEDGAAFRLSIAMSRSQLSQALMDLLKKRWKLSLGPNSAVYESPETLLQYWEKNITEGRKSFLRLLGYYPIVGAILAGLISCEGACADPDDKREKQRAACVGLFRDIRAGKPDLAERIDNYRQEFNRMAGSKNKWPDGIFAEVGDLLKAANSFLDDKRKFLDGDPDFERESAQMTVDLFSVASRVMERNRQLRQARSALDYEDMINETLELLRKDASMRERTAKGICFLLIDEFQDTDERQLEIAQLLTKTKQAPGLFFVGDVKQSIYYFRGAEVSLFKEVISRTPDTLPLSENFRTLPEVLCFINDFYERSQLLNGVEAYAPMKVHRKPAGIPCVECFIPEAAQDKELAAEKHERDALFIAGRIHEMCNGEHPMQISDGAQGDMRPVLYDDIVLLFRRGSYMDEYESAFRKAGIPYNRIAGAGFFQRREIQDILAFLKVIFDPWDEESLATLLRSPFAGLSDESLMRMALTADGFACAFHSEEVPEGFEQQERLVRARELFNVFYNLRECEPAVLLRQMLDRTGYEAVLLSQHLGLQRVANVRKVIQMADSFSQSRPASLAEFTHYLDDVTVRELQEGESTLQSKGMGAVTLMTIHKAKGLEFPVVFIPEMFAPARKNDTSIVFHHKHFGMASKALNEEGEFKDGKFVELMRRFGSYEELMESARVLYVAMTRARDYLVLCSHHSAEKDSWADILNKAYNLQEYAHDGIVEGINWCIRVKRRVPELLFPGKKKTQKLKLDIAAIKRQMNVIAGVQPEAGVISVSQLLSLAAADEVPEGDFEPEQGDLEQTGTEAAESGWGRRFAMARGSLVHRFFERWDFVSDTPPDGNLLVDDPALCLQPKEALVENLSQIACSFRQSELWPLYSKAKVIEKEVPFILNLGAALVRGVADAVIDDVIIVDYKTGMPGSLSERYYEMQLRLYAAALYKLKGRMPEQGILWYADNGHAHIIPFSENEIQETLAFSAEVCRRYSFV